MFIMQADSDGIRHGIATGKVVGKYKTYQNAKGLCETEFTICVKTDINRDGFTTLKVCAYGDTAAQIVKFAKLHKDNLVVFGNCAVDKAMTDLRGSKRYSMYASVILSQQMVYETYKWHMNSMQIDKILSDNAELNIRYDYEDAPKEEDHRI